MPEALRMTVPDYAFKHLSPTISRLSAVARYYFVKANVAMPHPLTITNTFQDSLIRGCKEYIKASEPPIHNHIQPPQGLPAAFHRNGKTRH
jgi:hypothetical protein